MSAAVPVKPQKGNARERAIAERIREAGERALAEAKARQAKEEPEHLPKEVNGAAGPEPTRFGDWERKGLISDF